MSSWPGDSKNYADAGRGVPRQQAAYGEQRFTPNNNNNESTFGQRPSFSPPGAQNPSSWRRDSLPVASRPSFDTDRRGSLGANLSPAERELVMMQAQREARNAEQLNLQRLSQALGFGRRRSSMSEGGGISDPNLNQDYGNMAALRLKKRRRISSPPTILSSHRGNSFPMPPLEGEARKFQLGSMEMYQKLWDDNIARSKLLFPGDEDKQKVYAKWRFTSALGGRRISFSEEAKRKIGL